MWFHGAVTRGSSDSRDRELGLPGIESALAAHAEDPLPHLADWLLAQAARTAPSTTTRRCSSSGGCETGTGDPAERLGSSMPAGSKLD